MDNIQNQINDFLEGPNEKVTKRATEATNKIIKEKYPNGFDTEIYNKILREQIKIARQEILDELKFEQEYKQQRHIGDIEQEERNLDNQNANYESEKMWEQFKIDEKIFNAEKNIVSEDIDRDFKPNDIVEYYRNLAQRYNIKDEEEVRHIIEVAMENPDKLLDTQSMDSIITDPEKKDEFNKMVEMHGGKINVQDLLSQLADIRIKNSKEYISEVAQEDINARAEGIQQKTETLKHFRKNSVVQEPYYENQIDTLEKRKKEISQEEIEKCSSNESLEDIKTETKFLKDRVQEKSKETKERE